ncbi:MAG: hypothetical protein COS34_13610 [Lysobacterales bacterium CG02_land_8_20_14_3_00_62_12]|nr:MAG: hypothetical protein COS34_13610 [Xanthomonadales bacterium CG02_land_8_20_14_3_00_62_12]PJA42163.1 MAG: hypothetical protein CO182_04085 [Xanthomonadales bacterium CG_4_9_14_3_um_filter_62_6]
MPTDDFTNSDQDFTLAETQWWLASLGNVMVWARLRLFSSGSADVLSSDGELIHYPDQREACVALMDANYAALDGMDEDDALAFDRELEELVPPTAESDADEDLVPLLIERIDANRTPGTGHI